MPTVKDILERKPNDVAQIAAEATVHAAAKLMNQLKIGALVVTRGDTVVGIFTERDVLTRVVARRADPAATRIEEVMTTPIACCQTSTTLEECRAVMTSKRIRHLPVVEENRLLGMISSGDILAHEAATHKETIQYLHEYLYGGIR